MGIHEPYFHARLDHETILDMVSHLRKLKDEFDTIVVTGVSGQFYGPVLAFTLGVNYCVVRKPNDGSHDYHPIVGVVGDKWIFLDDFISSGATRRRVISVMRDVEPASTYVGTFEYSAREWSPADKHYASVPKESMCGYAACTLCNPL